MQQYPGSRGEEANILISGEKSTFNSVRRAEDYGRTPRREEPAPVSQRTLNLQLVKNSERCFIYKAIRKTQAAEPGVI